MTLIDPGGTQGTEVGGRYHMDFKDVGQVFHYNRWNGIEVPEIATCFALMKLDEVRGLKKGNEVWKDLEPYHPNGKVYGYSRIIISRREKDGSAFEYEGMNVSGSFSLEEWRRTFRLTDQEKLEALLGQYGRHITDPFSKEQRESLQAFEERWDRDRMPR